LLRQIICERIADVENEKVLLAGNGRRDLLTRMIQESQAVGENWDEDDLIGHVRSPLLDEENEGNVITNPREEKQTGTHIHGCRPRDDF